MSGIWKTDRELVIASDMFHVLRKLDVIAWATFPWSWKFTAYVKRMKK